MNPLLNPILFSKILKSYLFDTNRVWRLSEEKIKNYQDKSLRKIVKFAYNVPLYHEKYKEAGVHPSDIKGIKDIRKLPFITKKDLRKKSSKSLIPRGTHEKQFHIMSTSGSSGQPLSIYLDTYTVFKTFIGWIRITREYGIKWNKNRITMIIDLSPESAEEAYFQRVAFPITKTIFPLKNFQVLHVGDKPEELAERIKTFNPELIGAYPGILKILAIYKKQGKLEDIEPRLIGSSGGVLDQYTREYIENAFNTKVVDSYGATECSPIAFQCKNGNYHTFPDFSYMELEHDKKIISPGDVGNLVITKLYGGGTPVIRYTGLSDLIVPSKRECSCGMNAPLIEKIEGRRVDSITLTDGKIIPPSSITGIPYKVMHKLKTDKIQQFQIIQQSKKKIDILIVIDEELRNIGPKINTIFEELKKQFELKVGKNVDINIKEVDKIKDIRENSYTPPPVVLSKVKEQ